MYDKLYMQNSSQFYQSLELHNATINTTLRQLDSNKTIIIFHKKEKEKLSEDFLGQSWIYIKEKKNMSNVSHFSMNIVDSIELMIFIYR